MPALKEARHDPTGLCGAVLDDLQDQIRFERRNSWALFNGASAFALLLWQTQALAILRKAAWQIEFLAGAKLRRQEMNAAEQRERALERLQDDPQLVNAGPVIDAFHAALANYQDRANTPIWDAIHDVPADRPYGLSFGLAEYEVGLSTEQNVVAALNGSTYCPSFDPDDPDDHTDGMDPLQWLQPIAE